MPPMVSRSRALGLAAEREGRPGRTTGGTAALVKDRASNAPGMRDGSAHGNAGPAPADEGELSVRQAVIAAGGVAYRWSVGSDRIVWSDNVADVLADADPSLIATGRGYASLLDADSTDTRYDAVMAGDRIDHGAGVPFQVEYRLRPRGRGTPDAVWVEDAGRWFAGSDGRPAEVFGMIRNVSERREREEQLRYLSTYDPLTGLLNSNRLAEALEATLSRAQRAGTSCALLLVTIDNLDTVNEAYGFDIADTVITTVCARLEAIMRAGDVIGRFAGNRFGLVLDNCRDDEMAVAAERFLTSVRDTVVDTGHGPVWSTISIGGVALPRYGDTMRDAIGRAEEALTEARRHPGDCFVAYRPSEERSRRRSRNMHAASEILAALKEDRLVLAYQPIIDAQTGRPVMYEALLRLARSPDELAPASDIVPVAEELGLIRLIDLRVLDMVLETLKRYPAIRLSANISGVTATDPRWFASFVERVRDNVDVADRLVVEVTETTALYDLEDTARFIAQLRELGCAVAVDDFGAGYSSFRNLKELNVDIVKLDGSFSKNLHGNAANQIFMRSLIGLAGSFGLRTVAEWVETPEDAELLKGWGIDLLQGYLFGRAETGAPWQTATADAPPAAFPNRDGYSAISTALSDLNRLLSRRTGRPSDSTLRDNDNAPCGPEKPPRRD